MQNNKLFLDVLNGQKGDRVPFWFMRQAGRYLPEYLELRAKKGGFMDMALDPDAAAEITVQPLRRFDMDAAIIFSDILMIPYGLGMDVRFVAGEGPKLDALENLDDLDRLKYTQMNRLNPVYQALTKTREMMASEGFDKTALIGFAGSPWTVATYMIEGGSSKAYHKIKTWAYQNPNGMERLMEILVQATSDYLIKQVEAGAEALQLFDSWCGVLDYAHFKRFSIAPTKEIVSRVKSVYPDIPVIGFPKGAGINISEYVDETGIDALGLDSQINPVWAAQNLQSKMPVQGNLDPLCLLAGGADLEIQANAILQSLGDKPFIFNLGHGIDKLTPIDHVEKLAGIIKAYKI